MVKDNYKFNAINWTEKGYFGCQNINKEFPAVLKEKPWYSVLIAISKAKKGGVYDVNRLLEIADKEISGILDKVCSQVFGDMGSDSCFQELIRIISTNENYDFTFQVCEALVTRGRLRDVSILLNALDANKDIRDAVIIPVYIRRMLDFGDYSFSVDPKADGLKIYRKSVESRVMMLCDHFGNDEVCIWRGDIFSIERVAHWTMDWAPNKALPFPMDVRRRLEATSGIDCSQFYHEGIFQPLAAMALAEKILDSNLIEDLKPGNRYFFGHQIPSF